MKILWVTPQLPCLRSGGQVRQYHLLKHLCQRHQVTILSLVQPDETDLVADLEAMGAEVRLEPFTPPVKLGRWRNRLQSWSQTLFDPRPNYAHTYTMDALQQQLGQALNEYRPDVVQFEHLFVAPLGDMVNGHPWILTEHNIESRNMERQIEQATSATRRLAHQIETKKLWRWEMQWVRRSTACVAMSDVDATFLQRMTPETPIHVVPNGVDTTDFTAPTGNERQQNRLLFFGTLGYAPNTDGVLYFCREIFPLIRAKQPDAILEIVGAHAPPEVEALGELPGVEFVGFVDDVRHSLWRAGICVVPLRSGGGTRLKILEAMAAGCPVVSTTVGAEGLNLQDGKHLCLADEPTTFARSVLALMADPQRGEALAMAGREAVVAEYDWANISTRLENAYNSITNTR